MQVFKYLVAASAAFVLVACGDKSSDNRKHLAVSIEPQRSILEQIAGPSFEVTTLMGRGADPETFDPSTAQRLAVDEADVYFATGVLPFEERLKESLGNGTEYIETVGNTELIYGTHGHDHGDADHDDNHGHMAVDPHYWSSIDGVRQIADVMAVALAKQYPDSSEVFDARLKSFKQAVDSIENYVAGRIAQADSRVFAVWHPSLSYFAREFGLEQLALGSEGKDLSAKALAEAIEHARADSVEVFFYQPGVDSRQAEVMNEGIGSRLVPVYPLAYEWQEQLKMIADEIARP